MGIGAIRLVRKLLVNTSANDWKSTGVIREWVYKRTNDSGLIEVEYFGVKLRVPGHDLGLAPGLLGGYYEKLQLSIFEQLASESQLIIDVGANIGLYTAVGAKNMEEQGKVISFEPIPANLELLRNNIKFNKQTKNVNVAEYALGEDDRTLEIYISSKSGGNHSVGGAGSSGYDDVLKVEQTSLDGYMAKQTNKKIDLIKIDVEGYDGYVLKGALKTIAKSHPALMIECIPKLLDRCNFSYQDFGKMLFDNYKYCYSINEVSNVVEHIDKKDFGSFLAKLNDTNLVLVQRPEHKKIIEKFLGK
jgi:FkbM family methyltransferase